MAKAVFTTKADPAYDDLPEFRYHFPRTYLRQAEAAVGDWIVYYEPRRPGGVHSGTGGRQAYFATARVDAIHADPTLADHFYAFVSDYLEFDRPVPFRAHAHYVESALRKPDGSTNKGAFGRAVRPLPDSEYDLILRAGFADVIAPATQAAGQGTDAPLGTLAALADEPATFERPVVERLQSRPFRDAAFAAAVKGAYANTCALTGLRIINGGGRAEVQAAHIRPVADQGPDSVRNGLALCATLHWMFDRGLVSLAADYTVLTTPAVPDTIHRLLTPDHRLHTPARPELAPHPWFLAWHRRHVFKG